MSDYSVGWKGKVGYEWFHSDKKDFSEQSFAYIILNGELHCGRIIKDTYMDYDEVIWYYNFITQDGFAFDLEDMGDEDFGGWGCCIVEPPPVTDEMCSQLLLGE